MDRGLRQHRQREPQEPIGAHLQEHAGKDDAACRWSLHMGVRQPGMERDHRHLDRECDKEGKEQPGLNLERQVEFHQSKDVEGSAALEIQHDDADQEQEAARQGVKEELERRIDPAVATPDTDDQIHRDQHRLPADVEQKQVEGREHTQHQGLHGEQADHELLHLAVDGDP
ncbi:hypothetical protein D9M72_494770 [compost metagenome]